MQLIAFVVGAALQSLQTTFILLTLGTVGCAIVSRQGRCRSRLRSVPAGAVGPDRVALLRLGALLAALLAASLTPYSLPCPPPQTVIPSWPAYNQYKTNWLPPLTEDGQVKPPGEELTFEVKKDR